MSLLDTSNHREVYIACKEVSAQWRDIGIRLGVEKPTLDMIQASNKGDVEMCMDEMIGRWLKWDTIRAGVDLPSWRSLCVTLSYIDKPLAEAVSLEHQVNINPIDTSDSSGSSFTEKEKPSEEQDGDEEHIMETERESPSQSHNGRLNIGKEGGDDTASSIATPSSLTTPLLTQMSHPPLTLAVLPSTMITPIPSTSSKDGLCELQFGKRGVELSVYSSHGELSSLNIIDYLRGIPHFTISAHWTLLLRLLGVATSDVHKSFVDAKIDSDVEHHLEDCLDFWLKQDVSQSWQKIDNVVEYIIEHEKATVVFKLLWPEIVSILTEEDDVTVQLVIGRLEAEDVITLDRDSDTLMDQLFNSLHLFVERNPSHNLLKVFKALFNHFGFFRKLKSSFEVECDLCYLELYRQPQESPVIPLSPVLKEEFDDVIQKYNSLIAKITDNISERLSETKLSHKLRKRLITSGECAEPSGNHDTMELLREYIKGSSSVINTKRLKNLCEKFGSSDILKKIEKYEKRREELCSTLTADKLIGRSLSTANTMECNTITFTVKWDVRKTKMDQIEELLYLAFNNCGSAIHVMNVKEGNSFTITCYAPEAIMGVLIYKAQKNLSLLKEKGVIFLKIGYCTLLDHKRKYEINTEFIHDDINESEKLKGAHNVADLKLTPDEVGAQLQKPSVKELAVREVGRLSEDSIVTMKPATFEMGKEESNHEKKMENLMKELEQLKNENKTMSEEMLKLKDKSDSLESSLKQWHPKEVVSDRHSYTQVGFEKKGPMRSMKTMLSKELGIHVVKRKVSQEDAQNLKESRTPASTLRDDEGQLYPPLELLMTQYSAHKSTHQYWYSPSFYTHPGGYKLCIKLIPSGQDKGEGTHLSMYVNMMSGGYDHLLPWPFVGVVNLQLRNQKGNNNHLDTSIVYDESTNVSAGRRVVSGSWTPSGTAALIGKGYSQWIRNEDLQYNPENDTLYLKNDIIIVRVNEVIVDQSRLPSVVVTPPTIMGEPSTQYVAEFKMPNFDTLKKNGKSWESKGFYTEPNESGYKFLLAVHPDGKHPYKGERVSVYAHLMKGKNDDTLRFPFRGHVTVQLVNQREDKNHVEHQIRYTNEDDPYGWRGGRVYTYSFVNLYYGRSYARGCVGFIKHDHLPYNKDDNTQYLTENGELLFRISVKH